MTAPHWLDEVFTFSAAGASGVPAPADWRRWLRTLFPSYVRADFAGRHEDLWAWGSSIHRGETPGEAFIAIWPRGGGKSTNAELLTTFLGVTERRGYGLYIRETQEMADKSVSNIAAMLEGPEVARHYPAHADRAIGKYGASKGWRRERLRTAGGFTVDAIGLDTAARGIKVDEQRPDWMVFDDIDGKHDSPATTAKKIATITSSILPAGSNDVAILAIQNLIIPDGFFTRLADGRADYLARRRISGPFPAVYGLKTEYDVDEATNTRRARIVSGEASWVGQDLPVCQKQIDDWGLEAFKKEAQHEVTDRSEGLALRYVPHRHRETLSDDEARRLCRMGRVFAGGDFGAWRFGVVLRAVDRAGVVHQIAEYFSQRENLLHRAKAIHAIFSHYEVPHMVRIRGDAANPTDIREINARLKEIGSPYRYTAVTQANKERAGSVERINDLLDRDVFLYRADVHLYVAAILDRTFGPSSAHLVWRMGYTVSSPGVETGGSRLQWEVAHWGYPVPTEGVAQKQDPDDNTADGADLIASDRYGTMSHLRPAAPEEEAEDDYHQPITPEMHREHAERAQRVKQIHEKRRERPIDPDYGEF